MDEKDEPCSICGLVYPGRAFGNMGHGSRDILANCGKIPEVSYRIRMQYGAIKWGFESIGLPWAQGILVEWQWDES